MENLEIPSGILALILVLFIFFSAFFSAAETALTGSNKLRLKNIARTGDKRASIVMKLLDSFDRTLTTILIGNNVVNIAAAPWLLPSQQPIWELQALPLLRC